MEIRSLDGDDPRTVAALFPGFRETMGVELPADPPLTEALLARMLQRRHGTDRILLAAYRAGRPAGCVKLGLDLTDPGGPGHGSLWVFPGFRRRGVGCALLGAAREQLVLRGRGLLMLDAPAGPAARSFATAAGASRAATSLRQRLLLTGPARARLRAAAEHPVPGYRLVRWCGSCPEELVESYARAWGTLQLPVNGQARPSDPSVADVRAREGEALRAGNRLHVVAALPGNGTGVVGYSTLFTRGSPMADAGEVLVLPDHRRRSLATWLKADLMLRAAGANPRLALVQTFNDHANGAVLALNRRLGFTTDSTWDTYAFEA